MIGRFTAVFESRAGARAARGHRGRSGSHQSGKCQGTLLLVPARGATIAILLRHWLGLSFAVVT